MTDANLLQMLLAIAVVAGYDMHPAFGRFSAAVAYGIQGYRHRREACTLHH